MENQEETNNKNASLSLIAEYGGSESESEAEARTSTEHDELDATELSEMVLKNNIINACAHGPLARAGAPDGEEYEIVPSGHMIIDAQSGDIGYEAAGGYRDERSHSDSSSDDSSDVDSVKEIEEASSGDEELGVKVSELKAPKVTGELGLEDLPPIEDLAISLPAHDTTKIGTVLSIVEQLVIVKGLPGSPAVDLDTVLFLDDGAKALGKVFDVFGPVTEPHYAVRFNSREHVAARGVALGADVCVAPRSPHTTYVFLPDLIKLKGSDASWKDDTEPPPSQIEYSDDEQERRAKRAARGDKGDRRRPANNASRFGGGGRGRGGPPGGVARRGPRPPLDTRTPPPHPAFGAPAFPMPPRPLMYAGFGRARAPHPMFAPYHSLPPQPMWLHSEPPPPPGT